jgi:uncharacterized damage-inducible protein DinB
MTQASPAKAKELAAIEIFRDGARAAQRVARKNAEGISHNESLGQPQPGGNCLNWVLGHLVCVYDAVLPMLGQEPVLGKEALRRYDRGTPELKDGSEALAWEKLLEAWDQASERFDIGLSSLTAERLDAPAPFSPRNTPTETVRSLLTAIVFHQAYHVGQLGILRRVAGKEGAIR